MKHSLYRFAVALALTLATTQSQADPFEYSYNWVATPTSIDIGASGVILTSNEGGTTNVSKDTAAANVTVFSSITGRNFTYIPLPESGSNYTLAVTLGDGVAGDPSGTITFSGLLQGKLSHDSSNLTNTITGVTDRGGAHMGESSGSVIIGYALYTISYNGFTAPTLDNAGVISFHISYDLIPGGGPTAPEPSGMVLGCLGLTFLGRVAYRVCRRKADLLNAAI